MTYNPADDAEVQALARALVIQSRENAALGNAIIFAASNIVAAAAEAAPGNKAKSLKNALKFFDAHTAAIFQEFVRRSQRTSPTQKFDA